MTVYILTPISETDGLPDGWYALYVPDEYCVPTLQWFDSENGWIIPKDYYRYTSYARPLPDAIAVTRETAEDIFKAGFLKGMDELASQRDGVDSDENIPDQQTYIDNLFNKK